MLGSAFSNQAVALRARAEPLRDRFERAFWCDELSTYALALDGDKRPNLEQASAELLRLAEAEPSSKQVIALLVYWQMRSDMVDTNVL